MMEDGPTKATADAVVVASSGNTANKKDISPEIDDRVGMKPKQETGEIKEDSEVVQSPESTDEVSSDSIATKMAGESQISPDSEADAKPKGETEDLEKASDPDIAPESDLRRLDRRIWVVTTASLPWRTGTSVNPLARALYLTRGRPKGFVTLLVPWLPSQDEQTKLFGEDCTFDKEEDQEKWIRQYCTERVHCESECQNLRIRFYPATYNDLFGSIFAKVDICALIPDEEADVAILEEPEHLTWFRVPPENDETVEAGVQEKAELGWAVKFNHVVGILHTNYSAYMDQYGMGASFIAASALSALSSMVVKAYCHRLIRLSATLPELDKTKEITCNVHGVRTEFFEPPQPTEDVNNQSELSPIYFIGKLVWAKGFDKLLEIEDLYKKENGSYFSVDVYGSGSDDTTIKRAFFGRKGVRANSQESNSSEESAATPPTDRAAAMLFGSDGSLRSQLDAEQAIEVILNEGSGELDLIAPKDIAGSTPNPISILGDSLGKTIDTSVSAATAGAKVGEKLVDLGFRAAFAEDNEQDDSSASGPDSAGAEGKKRRLRFDPPRSKYELRRHPIPARFLGVKDHAMIRDITVHKIFLNLSETEVLCTTTAEALAMGKFVIIPKHRK
jgi:hypothetical protein